MNLRWWENKIWGSQLKAGVGVVVSRFLASMGDFPQKGKPCLLPPCQKIKIYFDQKQTKLNDRTPSPTPDRSPM